MRRVAVVLAYSAECAALAKQCILSCYLSSPKDIQISFFAYQLNWVLNTTEKRPHIPYVNIKSELDLIGIDIIEAPVDFDLKVRLPDICVYDYFARNFLSEFDYVLFCHDDLLFHEAPSIRQSMDIVDKINFDIIAEPHIECSNVISARFYPHYIFVHCGKFLDGGLTFINDKFLFDNNIVGRPIMQDGGAGLLTSYYDKNRTISYRPYTKISNKWITHIKLGNDNGVESFNLSYPKSESFNRLMVSAQRYVDTHVFK